MGYTIIVPNEIIRIEFRLGFKVEHRIQLMLRKVFEEMEEKKEVVIKSRYDSLVDEGIPGDFRFVVIEKFLSKENELPMFDRIVMKAYFLLKQISLSEEKGFGLDPSDVTLEKFPLVLSSPPNLHLKRIN